MDNRKWNILIVDDEHRIGILIKKLIHQEDLNIKDIIVTTQGDEALDYMREYSVDVVITDIRMPQMNGLELICEAKNIKADLKFVVVSGYREFEYAQKALQYGVEDYLLKPVNEEELNLLLKRILESLLKKEKEETEKEKIQVQILESRQIIKRDILKDLIDAEELERDNLPVELHGDAYRAIQIKLDSTDDSTDGRKQDKLIVEKIKAIVEELLQNHVEEVLICEKDFLQIYCLVNYKWDKSKEITKCISDILIKIQNELVGLEQYEVTVGVGLEKSDFSEIRFSIQEAQLATNNRIKRGVGRLIYASEFSVSKKSLEERKKPYIKKFVQGIEKDEKESIITSLHGMFQGYLEEDEASWCYDLGDEIIELFFEILEIRSNDIQVEKSRIQRRCHHCNSLIQLKSVLREELLSVLNISREIAKNEFTRPVRQAKKYLEEHYQEKIVLEDLAMIVNLNPIYFSVLFKRETGMNFSAYLTEIRMKEAKRLLCNTNETISAIAESVGYKDCRYFSQTFTKIIGVKPALYRKLHS